MKKKLEDFNFQTTSEDYKSLKDLQGHYVILYFYPKDNTPGCTRESENFRDLKEEFKRHNALIFGISKDSLKSHEGFIKKYNLNFDLISDADQKLCNQFDVHKKNALVEKVLGINRSTFLIDPEGHLVYEWRNVKVSGHADEVLNKLKEVQSHNEEPKNE